MYNILIPSIRLILGKLEIIINDISKIIKYDSNICILNSKKCNDSAAPRATTKSPQQLFESQVYYITSMWVRFRWILQMSLHCALAVLFPGS